MIYLDYAATTPLDPEVKDGVAQALETYGNPSSIHSFGRRARQLLEEGRERLAGALGCRPRELVLTSGGSEANALALYGVALARGRGHLVSSQVEHSAVLLALRNLERLGFAVTLLAPDRYGLIYPEQVAEALRPDTLLVSLMTVNNETGTLYPVRAVAELCRARGVLFHTDAVQAFGTVPCRVEDLGADLISIAAHKFYGPKGAGALYVRRGIELFPLIPGKQEGGYRGGTENPRGSTGWAWLPRRPRPCCPRSLSGCWSCENAWNRSFWLFPGWSSTATPACAAPNTSTSPPKGPTVRGCCST